MVKVELAYVKPERDRQGRVTYDDFRRHGRRWRLPASYGPKNSWLNTGA